VDISPGILSARLLKMVEPSFLTLRNLSGVKTCIQLFLAGWLREPKPLSQKTNRHQTQNRWKNGPLGQYGPLKQEDLLHQQHSGRASVERFCHHLINKVPVGTIRK